MKKIVFFFLAVSVIYACPLQTKDKYDEMRRRMVERDMRDVHDKRVLQAMATVPRHLFVPEYLRDQAYEDHPLPIGEGQTISQPYIVALMTQELQIKPGDKVLEIGTGSGYQAAVLSELTDSVYTIEIKEKLAQQAAQKFRRLGYAEKIKSKYGDGYIGWEEYAPFDAIMITAAVDHIPQKLIEQLKEGGRIILPKGSPRFFQNLTVATKINGKLKERHITGVIFVPMTGKAQE